MDKTKITVPPADAPREQEMQFIHDLFIYTLSANLRHLFSRDFYTWVSNYLKTEDGIPNLMDEFQRIQSEFDTCHARMVQYQFDIIALKETNKKAELQLDKLNEDKRRLSEKLIAQAREINYLKALLWDAGVTNTTYQPKP